MEKNVSGLFVLYSNFRSPLVYAPDGWFDPKPTEIKRLFGAISATAPPAWQHCSVMGETLHSRQQKGLLGCSRSVF